MNLSHPDLAQLVSAWFWPFVRIAALVGAAPFFGHRSVPVRIKLALAFGLTLVVVPLLPPGPALDPLSGRGLLLTIEQVLVGLALGFSVRLVFAALELVGQQIAMLMGLGFANMIDPNNGINVPLVSQFYVVLATLVFLSIDGHLMLVQVIVASFDALPVAGGGLSSIALGQLVQGAGWIFDAAVIISLPAITAMLAVNLAFGVITKTAPQLNIFAVGFPVTLALGFLVMLISLPVVVAQLEPLYSHALDGARGLLLGAR